MKYEIIEKTIEVKNADRMSIAQFVAADAENPTTVETFNTMDEARAAFAKYSTQIRKFSTAVGAVYEVTEYNLEENDYNEDGEIVTDEHGLVVGSCVRECTKPQFDVVNDVGEVIATFTDYASADNALGELDDASEIRF